MLFRSLALLPGECQCYVSVQPHGTMAPTMADLDSPSPAQAPAPAPVRARWPRWLRWTTALGVLLVLVLVAGLSTAVVGVRRSWPQTGGELSISGLDGEVRVVRDEHGIPQIYADSTHDLMLAQGFVHAQDRFFEMDVRRHATAGRLSELFGKSGLETDLVVRTLGWREVAEKEVAMLRPATRSALDAYAEGVNAYLEGRSTSEMSLEYALLGITGLDYQPEQWTAVDSVAWLKAMAWDLRGNLDEEIGRAIALRLARSGADRVAIGYLRNDTAAEETAAILRAEGEAVLRAADALDGRFSRAVRLVVDCTGSVVVTGIGKAGLVARKISATLASTESAANTRSSIRASIACRSASGSWSSATPRLSASFTALPVMWCASRKGIFACRTSQSAR